MSKLGKVRLRIAPSPTGDPHVGTAYIALFNLAFARQQHGQFILRIEDTDRNRFVEESEHQIFDNLRWLGLHWDEGPDVGGPVGPYRQSERTHLYQEYARALVESGHGYYCWCSPERLERERQAAMSRGEAYRYDRLCLGKTREERRGLGDFREPPVVRMLVPDTGETTFNDLIRGPITFQNRLLDDQILLKSDGYPTYHLAVVVDDHLMGISHVLRGEEWISSTPKHVLLYRFFGWDAPQFAHLPLLRNKDRSKLSKRRNPWASLRWFREQGYLPEALVNFLGLMGFSLPQPPDPEHPEVFGLEDIVRGFGWDRFSTTGPIFDLDKMDWLNGIYIRRLSVDELAHAMYPFLNSAGLVDDAEQHAYLRQVAALLQERLVRLGEAPEKADFFFLDELTYDPQLLLQRGLDRDQALAVLREALVRLERLPSFDESSLEATLDAMTQEMGLKRVQTLMTIRVAVTGKKESPPIFATLAVLGRTRVLARLRTAISRLASQS